MRIREHGNYGHGLEPGTDADLNCLSCRAEQDKGTAPRITGEDETSKPIRRAVVGRQDGKPGYSMVMAYLPFNYVISKDSTDDQWVIIGRDNAGWTLDDYVIPRLASGPIFAKEV